MLSVGLQHAGKSLSEMVRKVRNPTANPGFVIKKMWERFRRNPEKPRLDLQLNNFLHPSLKVKSFNLCFAIIHFVSCLESFGVIGKTCFAISNGNRSFIGSTWQGSEHQTNGSSASGWHCYRFVCHVCSFEQVISGVLYRITKRRTWSKFLVFLELKIILFL